MTQIAWGAKVSNEFLARVRWIVEDLNIGMSTDDGMSKLLACMAWESGRTFSPSITNMAGSGATGLIQFMPSTAEMLGTTTTALAAMSAEDQLNYVWKYFSSYRNKLSTLSDIYMAILWPKAVGKPETYVLWDRANMPVTYRQNSGLDTDRGGSIIKAEASAKLASMLAEGMEPGNCCEYVVHANPAPEVVEAPYVPPAPVAPETEYVAVVTAAPEPQIEVAADSTQTDTFAGVRTTVKGVVDSITETATNVHTSATGAAGAVAEIGRTVVVTADTITTIATDPNTRATAIKKALSGWQGNVAGAVAIAGGLLTDPTFAKLLGLFTTALATGNGRWGAFLSLAGAGLIAYRHRAGTRA